MFSIYLQTIMLRELFAVFGFSELLLVLILFFWLLWGALGSFTYHKGLPRTQFAILGILGVLTPFIIRGTAIFLRPEFGLAVPIANIVFTGFISTVAAFFSGRAFSSMTVYGDTHKLYALEGLGAFTGGILSIIFIGILSRPFLAILSLFLLIPFYRQRERTASRYIFIVIIIAFAYHFAFPAFDKILWQGFATTEFESPYGRISILSRENENYIYENGKLIAAGGDTLSAEQIIHPIMWTHKSPNKVLLVGGLFKGAIRDILKHNPDKITLPFPDKKFLTNAIAIFPSLRNSINDKRIHIVDSDPRYFLRHNNSKFDIIISIPGFPKSGADNRFWTAEYFEQIRYSLADSGIVGIAIPVGANYLSEYQTELCASIWTTFKNVFPQSEIYFLDAAVLMVSRKNSSLNLARTLIQNSKNLRDVDAITVQSGYLPILFQQPRSTTLKRQLDSAIFAQINHDWHPLAYLWGILEESLLSGAKIPKSILINGNRKSLFLGIIMGGIIIILALIFRKSSAIFWVLTGGIWGIVSQTLFILLFQANFGNLYWLIGLATGIFLLGTSSGSLLGAKLNRNTLWGITIIFAIIILISIIGNSGTYIPLFIFLAIFLLSGLISGSIFGFCAKMIKSGGKLYGADLLGASIGTILALYTIPLTQPILIITGIATSILIIGILSFKY